MIHSVKVKQLISTDWGADKRGRTDIINIVHISDVTLWVRVWELDWEWISERVWVNECESFSE